MEKLWACFSSSFPSYDCIRLIFPAESSFSELMFTLGSTEWSLLQLQTFIRSGRRERLEKENFSSFIWGRARLQCISSTSSIFFLYNIRAELENKFQPQLKLFRPLFTVVPKVNIGTQNVLFFSWNTRALNWKSRTYVPL